MGIDTPLMQWRSYSGEEVEPVREYPGKALLLEPFEDFIGLIFVLTDSVVFRIKRLFGRGSTDPDNAPTGFFSMLNILRKDYLGPHARAYMPQFRHALSDPMVFLLKSWAVLRYELSQLRRSGL